MTRRRGVDGAQRRRRRARRRRRRRHALALPVRHVSHFVNLRCLSIEQSMNRSIRFLLFVCFFCRISFKVVRRFQISNDINVELNGYRGRDNETADIDWQLESINAPPPPKKNDKKNSAEIRFSMNSFVNGQRKQRLSSRHAKPPFGRRPKRNTESFVGSFVRRIQSRRNAHTNKSKQSERYNRNESISFSYSSSIATSSSAPALAETLAPRLRFVLIESSCYRYLSLYLSYFNADRFFFRAAPTPFVTLTTGRQIRRAESFSGFRPSASTSFALVFCFLTLRVRFRFVVGRVVAAS